jgi:hypothetical protein
MLLITLVLLATTLRLPPTTAIVPRVVGWPLALLLAWVLFREIRSLRQHRQRERAEDGLKPDQHRQRERAEDGPKPAAELGAILWLLALPALATVVGFLAGPALYVFAWARFRAGERLAVAVAAGAVTAGATYLLFSGLLAVQLPAGVLGYLR